MKKQNHLLEENQVVEWLIQILIAVQYMHKSRILHRDLKARNIFLKSNTVKIGDFGISRILVGTMDVASTFTGTPCVRFSSTFEIFSAFFSKILYVAGSDEARWIRIEIGYLVREEDYVADCSMFSIQVRRLSIV